MPCAGGVTTEKVSASPSISPAVSMTATDQSSSVVRESGAATGASFTGDTVRLTVFVTWSVPSDTENWKLSPPLKWVFGV